MNIDEVKKKIRGPMIPVITSLNKDLSSPLSYTPKVEEGDMIIFPSYLNHTVPAGKYKSYRVTIAINLNIQL